MRSDKSFTSSKHFKKLAISKVVVQIFIATVQRHIVNELEKIQNAFLWKNYTSKLKHEALCNDCKGGEAEDIDISNKIISL